MLRVQGCDGCTLIARSGRNPRTAWNKVNAAYVQDGKARLYIPKRITPYLTLEVRHPQGYSAGGASPFVAFGGSWVKGFWKPKLCWGNYIGASGTRIHIQVTQRKKRPYPGSPRETVLYAHLKGLPRWSGAGVNGTPWCGA